MLCQYVQPFAESHLMDCPMYRILDCFLHCFMVDIYIHVGILVSSRRPSSAVTCHSDVDAKSHRLRFASLGF